MSSQKNSGGAHVLLILALILPLMMVVAPLSNRFGVLPFGVGLLILAATVAIAALLLVATLVMLCFARFRANLSQLLLVATLAAVPVAVAAAFIVPNRHAPMIHDISTDIADPPQFHAVIALRSADSNPLVRDAEVDTLQRAGYPSLDGIESGLAPAQAFENALKTARSLGWQVHNEDPGNGLIEASETTFWFGFVDDVVIRVRAVNAGSKIDLRSVSRVGKGDVGANAKRIQRFKDAFVTD